MNRISRLGVLVFSVSMATSWFAPAAPGEGLRLREETVLFDEATTMEPLAPARMNLHAGLKPAQPVDNKVDVAAVSKTVPPASRRITRADYTTEELREMTIYRRLMTVGIIVGGAALVSMVGEYGFTGSLDDTRLAVVPALLGLTDIIYCSTRRGEIKDRVRARASVDVGILLVPDNELGDHAANRGTESWETGAYAKISFRW